MIRQVATLFAAIILGACQQDSAGTSANEDGVTFATVSTQNSNDTRIASEVFRSFADPTRQATQTFGGYSRGCQAGAVQLPETGPTWQAMRLSRNRNWTQPVTASFVQDLSAFAASLPGWAGIYVGDMSQPRGGPTGTGHISHQNGLDVDIWMRPAQRLNLSAAEREAISSIDMQRSSGAYVNSNWSAQNEAIIRRAASDPRVARIFVFPGAKVAMCANATGDRSWLNKVRPWFGHNTHFHVRLNCPPGDANCEVQTPPPPGDGCADAQDWVNNILNPRPADPNAPRTPPRAELRMAQLPGQCAAVAAN